MNRLPADIGSLLIVQSNLIVRQYHLLSLLRSFVSCELISTTHGLHVASCRYRFAACGISQKTPRRKPFFLGKSGL